MDNKNYRRLSVKVTAQTAGNLEKLMRICGYQSFGRVIDKLVREKMIYLHSHDTERSDDCERY